MTANSRRISLEQRPLSSPSPLTHSDEFDKEEKKTTFILRRSPRKKQLPRNGLKALKMIAALFSTVLFSKETLI